MLGVTVALLEIHIEEFMGKMRPRLIFALKHTSKINRQRQAVAAQSRGTGSLLSLGGRNVGVHAAIPSAHI